MRADDVKNPADALVYITDCCLATVSIMAGLKSRKEYEYQRQINIAQKACNWMKQMKIDPTGSRAEDIINKTTVADWAKYYEPKA